jgi:DedD protein
MEDRLKQRLVGASVLVALAVIFVPMLLDTSREPAPQPQLTPLLEHAPSPRVVTGAERDLVPYPVPPAIGVEVARPDTLPLPVPETVPILPELEAPAPQASRPAEGGTATSRAAPEPVAPAAPPLREAAPPAGAWLVQLGSFTREDNAQALHERLRAEGHASFVERAGEHYRVRVGPTPDRQAAERLRDRLEKEVQLKGMVTQQP